MTVRTTIIAAALLPLVFLGASGCTRVVGGDEAPEEHAAIRHQPDVECRPVPEEFKRAVLRHTWAHLYQAAPSVKRLAAATAPDPKGHMVVAGLLSDPEDDSVAVWLIQGTLEAPTMIYTADNEARLTSRFPASPYTDTDYDAFGDRLKERCLTA